MAYRNFANILLKVIQCTCTSYSNVFTTDLSLATQRSQPKVKDNATDNQSTAADCQGSCALFVLRT